MQWQWAWMQICKCPLGCGMSHELEKDAQDARCIALKSMPLGTRKPTGEISVPAHVNGVLYPGMIPYLQSRFDSPQARILLAVQYRFLSVRLLRDGGRLAWCRAVTHLVFPSSFTNCSHQVLPVATLKKECLMAL